MAPEEWPIAEPSADRKVAHARTAGGDRLRTVCEDFFLDPAYRLTEQERALMSGMLADLLGGIADAIRAGLPADWAAANDDGGEELIGILASAGLIQDLGLIRTLLRRADEERIGAAVHARVHRNSPFLQALVADSDERISAAAMALILARGRRRDRFGQLRLELDDLSTDLAARLIFSVAAAVREQISGAVDAAELNREVSAAAEAIVAQHDQRRGIEGLASDLVNALSGAGRFDERLLESAAEDGDACVLVAALASRAGIHSDPAWDYMLDAKGGFTLLMRLAGLSRESAARLLALLGDLFGIGDPAAEIARFDRIEEQQVELIRSWLSLDHRFRSALQVMGGRDNGQRAV